MKCAKQLRIKWIIMILALVFISRNFTLTGELLNAHTARRLYSAYQIEVTFPVSVVHANKRNLTLNINSTGIRILPKANSSDGYNLASRMNKFCNRTQGLRKRVKVFGTYEWGSVETCIIWKIGTTFLKRLYMMKKLPEFRDIVNPYVIRFDKRYLPNREMSKKNDISRFMFVRNPYNRLISGYVDKLLAPNPIYWKIIGIPAIRNSRQKPHAKSLKCGHDLEFHEYIKYVIKAFDPKQKSAKMDGHFDRMTSLCKPCGVKYDFVGKMESFAEDSVELARRLKLTNQTINLIEAEGGRFSWLDAIKDTAHQPFDKNFRKDYIHCISFYNALTRSWKKMQIRGIIGRQDFPMNESQTVALTEEQFVELAVAARDQSTSEERKQLQREHFLQMFSKVSKSDLEKIRKIYEADFHLFEYDDKPDILFGNEKDK